MHRSKGFTLIEILVVIAIIGILASIVLVSLGSARTKATEAKVQSELSSMRGQAEIFFGEYGDYGSALSSDSDVCRTSTGGGSSSGSLFQPQGTSGLENGLDSLIQAIPLGFTVTCYTDPSGSGGLGQATGWAITAENPDGTAHWCVDSTNAAKSYGSSMDPVVAAVCP